MIVMNNRDRTLDIAKGILIILVVLGHSIQFSFGPEWLDSEQYYENIVFRSIYSFHMPLFMMISGYLFYNSNKKDFKPLAVSKLRSIGIPMLSFLLISDSFLFVRSLLDSGVSGMFKSFITDIFTGMTMWFLLSLLINMACVAFLTRLVKNREWQYVVMILLMIAGMFIPDSIVSGVHKWMYPFFCLGYILKQLDVNPYACSSNFLKMSILTILSILAILWFDKETYIYTSGFCILGKYASQSFIDIKRLFISLVVSYTFMQYAHILANVKNRFTDTIIRLGQMSLFIYGFNIIFITYFAKALSFLSWNIGFNYIVPAIVSICFIILSYYLYELLEKYSITRILFLGK